MRPVAEPVVKSDGRRLRTERTRLAIAKAMTDLMNEGRATPTREEIATRAGISVRALFLHFPNVQDLIVAELDRVYEELRSNDPLPASMPLRERVAAFVDRRAEAVARLAPHLAAATVDRAPEVVLQDRIDQTRLFLDEEVRVTFEIDLAGLPAADRAACTVALQVLLAPMMWDTLSRERELTRPQVRDMLRTIAVRLLIGADGGM